MSQRAELMSFPLASVAQRCAQETNRYFRRQVYDPRFCFELFRRAFVDQCQQAWECVYAQYQSQVTGWVKQHSAFPFCGEEPSYLANRAFTKMWVALSPDRFAGFRTLASLLSYLKMCAGSVLVDSARRREREGIVTALDREDLTSDPKGTDPEKEAIDNIECEAFWQKIGARLKNEKERCVVRERFVLGFAPREICERYPELFCRVQEVYRVQGNVLARLKRDHDLADEFAEHA